MKIWIDLRFLKNDIYSNFIIQLVKSFIESKKEVQYIIYTNDNIKWLSWKNIIIKKVDIWIWTLKEQTKFFKILKNDNNNLMLFFNHFKPIFYKWEYIILIWGLKDIYYMNFSSYINKYKFLYLMEKNLKKAYKLICLDQNTKNELIEKFNIKESKINIINAFFPNVWFSNTNNETDLNINIKSKYHIKNDFLIYSWWDSIEKNYEKLISVLSILRNDWYDLDLVFLGEKISKNLSLRNIILEKKLEKNVFFLWILPLVEKKLIYSESLWTIFTSFYEPFPFKLTEPLFFWTKILSSDLKNIKNIFNENIKYFSPISVNNIYENIKKFINEKENNINDYSEIIKKYNIENTTKQLIEIIK